MKSKLSFLLAFAFAMQLRADAPTTRVPLLDVDGHATQDIFEITWDKDGLAGTALRPIADQPLAIEFAIARYSSQPDIHSAEVFCGRYVALATKQRKGDLQIVRIFPDWSLDHSLCSPNGIIPNASWHPERDALDREESKLKDVRAKVRSNEQTMAECRALRQRTIDRKQSDLTVREADAISACREAGLYK